MFESARPLPAGLAARWFLWAGTACLWASVFTGLCQHGRSVVITDVSGAFLQHRFLGFWVALVFAGISVWRFLAGRRPIALLALVYLAALWMLGMQIVYGRQLTVF